VRRLRPPAADPTLAPHRYSRYSLSSLPAALPITNYRFAALPQRVAANHPYDVTIYTSVGCHYVYVYIRRLSKRRKKVLVYGTNKSSFMPTLVNPAST
jgi:hypothetical protein